MSIALSEIQSAFSHLEEISFLVSGGQKHVYSCKHSEFGKVVLKIFESGFEIDRIAREVRASNSLGLKNAPKIREEGIGKINGEEIYYFIEDFIDGEGLDVIIKRGKMDYLQVIEIGCGLLSIIADAERKMVVHRDIKPSNVIISRDNKVWLLDYGIARHIDLNSLTNTSDVMAASTPGYAPIEQFKNRKIEINSRSDLFSIGINMYECLTGENPYRKDAGNFFEILDRVENTRLPKLTGFTSDGELEELIFALTQPNQEHRPLSAGEAFDWISEIRENI